MDPTDSSPLGMPSEDDRYLGVTIERRPPTMAVIVHVEGRLDAETLPVLRQRLATVGGRGLSALVFDLSRVQFLSSAGVCALLEARRKQKACGRPCLLVNLPPSIRRVLDVMDVFPAADVFADLRALDRHLAARDRDDVGSRAVVSGSAPATGHATR